MPKLRQTQDVASELAAQDLVAKARSEGIVTAFDRASLMDPRCGFGLAGICCRQCLEGPCRISPKAPRGVCGADADTIVARNFLGMMTSGAAPHVEHAREVVLAFLEACQGKAPYQIREPGKLMRLARKLGIPTEGREPNEIGMDVARAALEDFGRQHGVMKWVEIHTAPKTIEKWNALGVTPVNPHLEIARATNKQAMGVDADPLNLMLGAITMGLVDGYGGLHMSTDLQDVLLGVPRAVETTYRLGVLKQDHVNLAVHGHIPLLSDKVVQWAEALAEEARAVGARGINVVGVCCTGNEVLMRRGIPSAGNYASQELPILTGILDAMVVDCQCIMPSLPEVARCYHTEIITTMSYAKVPGATHVEFSPEHADEVAMAIVRKAIAAFRKRDPGKIRVPTETQKAVVGFSTEQILEALAALNPSDPLRPLADAIASGQILGVAAVVGCTNPRYKQDWANVEFTRYLLRHNVLVVATGCAAHSLGKAGLLSTDGLQDCGEGLAAFLTDVGRAMGLDALPAALHMGSCVDNSRVAELLNAVASYLDVPIAELPVIASSPETHSPKAYSIGGYFLAHGVDVHTGVSAPISGSRFVTTLLTGKKGEAAVTLAELFGGRLVVEEDPHRAAEVMLQCIIEKRKALGLACPEPAAPQGE